MKYSFGDTMEQAKKDYGLGKGEYFKPKDGDNKIRVLSPAIAHQSEYKGKVRVQFPCWIIDRADGKIKVYFTPATIVDAIAAFQKDEDYAFDEVPMPYDVNIKAVGAGTREVKYQVVPSPKLTPLTETETIAFAEKPSIEEVVQKLKEQEKSSLGADSSATQDPDAPAGGEEVGEDVPF